MAKAIMAWMSPVPMTPIRATMSSRPGNDIMASMQRMTIQSTHLPVYPLITPMMVPRAAPNRAANPAAKTEERMAKSSWLSSS